MQKANLARMSIFYQLEGQPKISAALLKKVGVAVANQLKIKADIVIGLKFVDEQTSQTLNRSYAKNDYPTDVLSFEYEPAEHPGSIGDIAICDSIAAQQAQKHGLSLESELVLLLVHGSLHLLGSDHQNQAQAASMDQLQSAIMKELNYNYRDFEWYH